MRSRENLPERRPRQLDLNLRARHYHRRQVQIRPCGSFSYYNYLSGGVDTVSKHPDITGGKGMVSRNVSLSLWASSVSRT